MRMCTCMCVCNQNIFDLLHTNVQIFINVFSSSGKKHHAHTQGLPLRENIDYAEVQGRLNL